MISKGLLDAVFGIDTIDMSLYDTLLRYNYLNDGYVIANINVYELAHKCKEWALKQGWYLNAWITVNEGAYCDAIKLPSQELHSEADTEPEAIFKACEWILEQKATS